MGWTGNALKKTSRKKASGSVNLHQPQLVLAWREAKTYATISGHFAKGFAPVGKIQIDETCTGLVNIIAARSALGPCGVK